MQYFHFSIKQENYFIPLKQVLEVSKYVQTTNIPLPGPGIRGICNIREKIYPVLDLNLLYTKVKNEDTKILMLCNLETWTPALLVDEVHGIINTTEATEKVKIGEYEVIKVGDASGVILDLNNLNLLPPSIKDLELSSAS